MKALKKLDERGAGQPSMALQGLIYIVGGLWPLVHFQSFSRTLKPAAEPRLVRALGGVFAIAGAVLVLAGVRARLHGQPISPGATSTAGLLAGVEIFTAFRSRVSPIVIANAALEAVVAAGRVAAAPESAESET